MISEKIGCVIVTFNRLAKLKQALHAYEGSSLLPKYILVVDNHSTDGTAEYLKKWQKTASKFPRYVHTMSENSGGAGGFFQGMKEALSLDADWIWVADDDAYPEQEAIGILDTYLQHHEDQAAICTSVQKQDGSWSIDHRRRLSEGFLQQEQTPVDPIEYEKEVFSLDLFSFVGVVISKRTLKQAGLPIPGYFIHCDDTEHSIRVRKSGNIICLPRARMVHDSPDEQEQRRRRPDWKYYYSSRNTYDMERRHFPSVFVYHLLKDSMDYSVHLLLGRKRGKYRMRLRALISALLGRQGLESPYLPGWKADFED